jgi:predicted permease
MTSLVADLRYAFRTFLRRPLFSSLAVLTLAVGIGINTVAFTGVNALLFHPFVFPGVARLGWVMLSAPGAPHGDLSAAEFEEIRRQAHAFDSIAAEGRQPLALMNGGRAEQVWALFVSERYFAMLGARPIAGRLDLGAKKAGALAAVVSFRFWRARLGGGSIAGRTIVLANRTVAVAGVLPDDFQGPGGLYAPDLWLALDQADELGLPQAVTRDADWLTTIGHLAPGATPAQASAELAAIAAHLPPRDPRAAPARLGFFPMQDGHPEVRGLAPFVWIALWIVSLVLLIACFNVGSLLLARGVERRREIAIKAALGAGRLRIVRQLIVEGLVLASMSGAIALALATWSERLLALFSLPAPIPQRLHLQVDGRVIAFTALLVIAAGILPPLLPALRATRRGLAGSMRVDGEGRPSRLRHLFIGAQIAGSTLFLATALLFVRSFANASRADLGFDAGHLLVLRLEPAAYGVDGARAVTLARELVERVRADSTLAVAAADRAPFAVG